MAVLARLAELEFRKIENAAHRVRTVRFTMFFSCAP
jgi:hypothetical protein